MLAFFYNNRSSYLTAVFVRRKNKHSTSKRFQQKKKKEGKTWVTNFIIFSVVDIFIYIDKKKNYIKKRQEMQELKI